MTDLSRQSDAPKIGGANTASRAIALCAQEAISKMESVAHISPCQRVTRGQVAFNVDLGNRNVRVVVSADG